MFEEHTFFKGPEGGIYGVSPRVMNQGFIPPNGHVPATQEEKDAFLQRVVDTQALPRPVTPDDWKIAALDLSEKGLNSEAIKTLMGFDPDEFTKADKKEIKTLKEKRDSEKPKIEEVISPEPPTRVALTPAQRRRELHRERRAAKAKEFERKELEENILFGDLSEDELLLMDTLQFQGLNMDQIRNILVAKRAKKEE